LACYAASRHHQGVPPPEPQPGAIVAYTCPTTDVSVALAHCHRGGYADEDGARAWARGRAWLIGQVQLAHILQRPGAVDVPLERQHSSTDGDFEDIGVPLLRRSDNDTLSANPGPAVAPSVSSATYAANASRMLHSSCVSPQRRAAEIVPCRSIRNDGLGDDGQYPANSPLAGPYDPWPCDPQRALPDIGGSSAKHTYALHVGERLRRSAWILGAPALLRGDFGSVLE
jgi:hypothetical protein